MPDYELTDKGERAVEEMDRLYREKCLQLSVDPNEWRPDLWIEANKDYEL